MKQLLKNLFFLTHKRKTKQGASILGYHAVGNDRAFFSVSPSVFERQLTHIQNNNLRTLLLSELVAKLKKGEDVADCVVITFHDGYKNNYTNAFPLLKKYRMKATFFVIPELLDSTIRTSEGYEFDTLAVDEILEMQDAGMECMSQTAHRQPLHEATLSHAAELIEEARINIEGILGRKAPLFSYPHGKYTSQLAEYLENNNWKGALTMNAGLVKKDINVFALPRNSVTSKVSFTHFKAMLTPAIDAYSALRNK